MSSKSDYLESSRTQGRRNRPRTGGLVPAILAVPAFLFLFCIYPALSSGTELQDALLEAAEKGDGASVKSLLAKGADIDGRAGYRQQTALIGAAGAGKDEVVKLLLAKGADPNVPDKIGATALIYGAGGPYATTVRILLDAGARVNVMDALGGTALTAAVVRNQAAIVEMLLAGGADVNAKNPAGQTAWSIAMERGFRELAAVLKSAGAKEDYDSLAWSGQYSSVTRAGERTITNSSMWRAFWADFFNTAPPLDIDFTKYMAACIFLGSRPTGGYAIEFGTPYEELGKMVIPFRERKPAGFVTQVITHPFAVRVFKKKNSLAVVFKKEEGPIEGR
jgi:hypothetical protein